MNDKFLSMLGIARGAGKVTMGHDMAMGSVMGKKSFGVFIAEDCSERLISEFQRAVKASLKAVEVTVMPYSINVIHKALGYKAGVISVNDEGIAKRLIQLLNTNKEDNNL